MKKRKSIKSIRPATPRSIHIEELPNGEYRLYKVWPGDKKSGTPFLITDDVEELVASYDQHCKSWNIKPDLKTIFRIVSNQKAETNETNFSKGGIF